MLHFFGFLLVVYIAVQCLLAVSGMIAAPIMAAKLDRYDREQRARVWAEQHPEEAAAEAEAREKARLAVPFVIRHAYALFILAFIGFLPTSFVVVSIWSMVKGVFSD